MLLPLVLLFLFDILLLLFPIHHYQSRDSQLMYIYHHLHHQLIVDHFYQVHIDIHLYHHHLLLQQLMMDLSWVRHYHHQQTTDIVLVLDLMHQHLLL